MIEMTPELKAYLDFDPKSEDDGYAKQSALRKLVNPDLLRRYRRAEIDALFEPKNEKVESRKEFLSPSGKYKLITSEYATKPGCWSYEQGRVFKVGEDTPIATVNRNYGSFPFLFVEGHPNGHDYLVCGEDYQGQTVIELDTGKRKDHLPSSAEAGSGFCWASFEFHAGLLVVCGCYWAAPYEYRFYDFSDPMSGWPELETEGYIDADDRHPTFEPDGTIKTYQTKYIEPDDDATDEECQRLGPIASTCTFRREGNTLVLVSEDVTPEEQERRRKVEESNRKWEAFVAHYKATDPLWLRVQKLVAEAPFKVNYMSVGSTYKGWCPTWEGEEKRFCQNFSDTRVKKRNYDLDLAHETGPVKLVVSEDGKMVETLFFEHSVEGVEQAFAHARGLS